jgi:hypothetical protein
VGDFFIDKALIMRALLVVNVASKKNLTLHNSRHLSALISGKICENLREILQHFKQLQCSGEFSRRFAQIAAQICADFFSKKYSIHSLPITRTFGAAGRVCAT